MSSANIRNLIVALVILAAAIFFVDRFMKSMGVPQSATDLLTSITSMTNILLIGIVIIIILLIPVYISRRSREKKQKEKEERPF